MQCKLIGNIQIECVWFSQVSDFIHIYISFRFKSNFSHYIISNNGKRNCTIGARWYLDVGICICRRYCIVLKENHPHSTRIRWYRWEKDNNQLSTQRFDSIRFESIWWWYATKWIFNWFTDLMLSRRVASRVLSHR